MAILKKPYEISVWDEKLGDKGQKIETKSIIIGAHDMEFLGKATAVKLQSKLNGTHVLTFQMPSKFFDSEKGCYIHNEFCDYIFNERKIKLKYQNRKNQKPEWYEFYVKNITENKHFKSIVYEYTCQDSFIDELSRNGYGLTFDTELYNNVEEIGTFTEEILEDSIWSYDATMNIGDFTQYSEEKLFKIPVSQFKSISGYKIEYGIQNKTIKNVFTNKERQMEIGDDAARDVYFWDNGAFDDGFELTKNIINNIPNDGYIYIPYNQLDFCYAITPSEDNNNDGIFKATETAQSGTINGVNSYYLSPNSIDPSKLIQFIAIPNGAEVEIDEAGLLVNKNYHYVMTVAQWNKNVNTKVFYQFEDCTKSILSNIEYDSQKAIHGNMAVTYDGYLEQIGDIEVNFGKAISISDRTECNISKEIDQFVTVYQNDPFDYHGMYTNKDWVGTKNSYRVCSKIDTRQIIPQLARNLIQNGIEITTTDGWELMKTEINVHTSNDLIYRAAAINVKHPENTTEDAIPKEDYWLEFTPSDMPTDSSTFDIKDATFINFGIIGQEKQITSDKIYYLCLNKETNESANTVNIIIGDGSVDTSGDYSINNNKIIIKNYTFGNELLIKPKINIENPYFAIEAVESANNILKAITISKAYFFEAYSKGIDFFDNAYFRYSGRELSYKQDINAEPFTWHEEEKYSYGVAAASVEMKNCILFETDIMEGSTYEYKKYFIQQLIVNTGSSLKAYDTFKAKEFLSNKKVEEGKLPLSSSQYTEDDYEIITDYLDMSKCSHYNGSLASNDNDCNFNSEGGHVCLYQKYGYCPYLFKTQKHCRKINTLNGQKSNRFNLTQEIGKIFEAYPVYYIEHNDNGSVVTDSNGRMKKKVFYMTEKGNENKLGFKYEKNLSNISRTFNSNEIVTKLYVEDVDSDLSKTGLCSIKTAEDNPSKDSFIIDFSYYILNGLLNKEQTEYDLYGKNNQTDLGYLKQLGYYNTQYDILSNKIINLQDQSYTELEANVNVNLTGIETAMNEINKTKKKINRYKAHFSGSTINEENETYKSYLITLQEQTSILIGLIKDTFFSDNSCCYKNNQNHWVIKTISNNFSFINYFDNITIKEITKLIQEEKTHIYKNIPNLLKYGMVAQYLTEYKQLQTWKKERENYLRKINELSLSFYQKYEPYLKEGTWSDSNYLSDNSYYFGAKEVAKEGAIPKITYNITVIDLDILDKDEDYHFDIADTTYIEDIETFGINQKTGLPNHLKVIISGITNNLDIPTENQIEIQNYTTQFEDLFEQISASVQSLSFNENIYKRSSNFTATRNIEKDSLQGTLDNNDITLLETNEKNIELNHEGQSGSDINNHNNKYKLNGQGLFFSNDGGQKWNTGVGPGGINADYIKTGNLDAGRIRIIDNNYLYFLWDKNGIIAYRKPYLDNANNVVNKNNDYALFNRYGLSLVEEGKVRLRAGYAYNGEEGQAVKEDEITDNAIGFYLYDKKGNPIFKTETADSKTARLSLAGEIYATQSLKYDGSVRYKYSFSSNENKIVVAPITFNVASVFNQNNILQAELCDEITKQPISGNTFKNYYDSFLGPEANVKYFKMNDGTYFSCKKQTPKQKNIFITGTSLYYTLNVNVYSLVALNEDWTVPEGTDGADYILFTRPDNPNTVYELSTISTITNYQKINVTTSSLEIKTNLSPSNFTYLVKNGEKYNTISATNKFVYQDSNNRYYLYDNKSTINVGASDSDAGVAIFINNQALSSDSEKNGYHQRLLCCAATENGSNVASNKFKNILSVLSDGRLVIGGYLKTPETCNLELLSDYVKIDLDDEENKQTIAFTPDGQIQIGGQDLAEGIRASFAAEIEAIRLQLQNSGLIAHDHEIGGVAVESDGIVKGNNLYQVELDTSQNNHTPIRYRNFDQSNRTLSNSYLLFGMEHRGGGETENKNEVLAISIEDFCNAVKMRIKEDEKTKISGGVTGNYGTIDGATTGYVVEGE